MSVAVVYLARGVDGGLEALRGFFESYEAHDAGVGHVLYVLFKGWDGVEGVDEARALVEAHDGVRLVELPDDGFDFGAYGRAVEVVEEEFVCFLNTHSLIEVQGWLGFLIEALRESDVGLVGCTASYGTIVREGKFIWPLSVDIGRNRGWHKGIYNFFKAWAGCVLFYPWDRQFPSFPNPHIRSNAFGLRTAVFRGFMAGKEYPQNKRAAFQLESGYGGMTRFVQGKGLRAVVVNDAGDVFSDDAFLESETFRVPQGQRCLVSDNQTRYYADLAANEKRLSEMLAWGRMITKV